MQAIQQQEASTGQQRHQPPTLYYDPLEVAVSLAVGYFARLAAASGLTWDEDNTGEVRLMVQLITDAARLPA